MPDLIVGNCFVFLTMLTIFKSQCVRIWIAPRYNGTIYNKMIIGSRTVTQYFISLPFIAPHKRVKLTIRLRKFIITIISQLAPKLKSDIIVLSFVAQT